MKFALGSAGTKIAWCKCDICGRAIAYNNNTSAMAQHLLSTHSDVYDEVRRLEKLKLATVAGNQPPANDNASTTRVQWTNTRSKAVNIAWVKWMLHTCQPISCLSNAVFKATLELTTNGAYSGACPQTVHQVGKRKLKHV